MNKKHKPHKTNKPYKSCNPTMPEYTRFTISLPTPPGVEPLPPSIFFKIDNRFTPEQVLRIRNSIVRVISLWFQHYEETEISGTSQWAACSNKYATKKLRPVWLEPCIDIPNGRVALEVMMNSLTQAFADNGNEKVPPALIRYKEACDCNVSNILGEDGCSKTLADLSITVNPVIFENPALTDLNLTGSLFHAWGHSIGYRHPKDIYTSYLIAEAPMCYMRGFQDKVPGQPDSVYTQFFD